jgi:hypothetical protein
MPTRRPTILAFAAVVVFAAVLVWLGTRPTDSLLLTQTYHNTRFGFSLRLPANYTITETTSTNPPAFFIWA